MSLKNKSILVSLNVSQWVGRKLDRKATSTVESAHGTDRRVGNFTKKLLPGAKEIDDIGLTVGALRRLFYEKTLPWAHDGARILSNDLYMEFMAEFRQRKAAFESAVNAFEVAYPILREDAKLKLGDLFNESDYPSPEKISTKFRCEIQVFPIPDQEDFRIELSEAEKTLFLESMKSVEQKALNDCYNRLYEVVSHASQKLSDPNSVLRESLVKNIESVLEVLPRLNPIEDERLNDLQSQVKSVISKTSVETLRVNETSRQDTAKALNEITSQMAGIFGGTQ